MTALTHVTGDFAEAVRVSGKVLAIRGRIFPSTMSNVHLEAPRWRMADECEGKRRFPAAVRAFEKLELVPRRVRPLPKAVEAIQEADLILMGPGSLFTSVIPNLLIPEIARAIVAFKGAKGVRREPDDPAGRDHGLSR